MTRRRLAIVAGTVAVAIGMVVWPRGESSAAVSVPAPVPASEARLACRFDAGETAAFVFESSATLEAGSGADRFAGLLSWVVVDEGDERGALLRASLREVTLEQSLSEERVRVAELEDAPFYVHVDAACRFGGLGFSPRWSAASRRLVATLLGSAEVVLPDAVHTTSWEVEQRDGVGTYTASYRADVIARGERRIVRSKPAYHDDERARSMGIRVQLLGAEAVARFDPARPGWMQEIEGRERVRFHVSGEVQGLVHRFRMTRADARYVAVSDALGRDEADFADVLEGAPEAPSRAADPALLALDHDEVRARFLALFQERGRSAAYPAARLLADWLRAHPEESGRLLEDLRSGAIDAVAHASLFLALELAGTDASREVLSEALLDARLSEVDRARAASALADHGEPSSEAATLLLDRARTSSASAMVASVSLLGVGRMARRADGALRAELHEALEEELSRASDRDAELVVIDALGNAGDDSFAPALDQRLGADDPALRAHAAEALGHLSPEIARPMLSARLEHETSPRVSTAIVRTMSRLGAPALTERELELAGEMLATSTSAEARAAVIDWLGRAQDQHEARQLLARHFHDEASVELQQRIGAYLPPTELAR